MKSMKKYALILCAAASLAGCVEQPFPDDGDTRTLYVVRVFPTPEHGSLTVDYERAPEGTWVQVYVNPEPGYVFDDSSLRYQSDVGGNPSGIAKINGKYQFSTPSSPGAGVSITGTFKPKPEGEYTVSIASGIRNGVVYVEPTHAAPGTRISLVLVPAAGYDLKPGTLSWMPAAGASNAVPTLVSEDLPYAFDLPAEDIAVSAEFMGMDYTGLMESARKYLNAGKYDNAASFYEEAYKRNNVEPEAVFYSTIGQLANMLLDKDVRSLLSSLYFSSLPGNLEDWVCDPDYWTGETWYRTYLGTEEIPEDATLPKINTRISGFATPYGDFKIAQVNPQTRQTFNNNLFWALISSYRSGFNDFVDRVNRYVFGDKFEAIAKRAESFPETARVLLNERLKKRFKLEELYGEGEVYVGKMELDYLFANLRLLKAAFEYLAVYDWSIDLRPWMVTEIAEKDGFDEVLMKMFELSTGSHKDYWNNPSTVARILPFKNNFLSVRNTAYMSRARVDTSKALGAADKALAYWYRDGEGTSRFIEQAKAKYQYAKDGVSAAKAALDGDGVFYFPKNLPKPDPSAVWPDASSADYAVNVPMFFKPGVFSLQNIFTTELGGRAPSLYKIKWYEDRADSFKAVITDVGVPVTEPFEGAGREQNVSGSNGAPYGIWSFEINTKSLRDIFPKGFEQSSYNSRDADGNLKTDAAYLYEVFPHVLIWPFAPSYFKGTNSAGGNPVASHLYRYYHQR
ncbi:MAG: hypothetical protein LBH75_08700 [Treponema sp.]|jgi:hypothetical protein|nr:hypothetical protein [Treponema sp.]